MTHSSADRLTSPVIIVGGGLAGLVARTGLVRPGSRVPMVERKTSSNLGGHGLGSGGGCISSGCTPGRAIGALR